MAFAIVEQPTAQEDLHRRDQFLADLKIRRIWYPNGRHDLIKPLLTWLADRTVSSSGAILRKSVQLMKTVQDRQQDEIGVIQFLLGNFVNQYEFDHLTKLASDAPFPHRKNDAASFFKAELRHLAALHLIKRKPDRRIEALIRDGETRDVDVKDYVHITNEGKKYLEMRKKLETLAQTND